jgi:transcriptional regulator
MYVPRFNAMDDETELRALVASVASAQFVTTGADGVPIATLLPILWEGNRIIAHMAKANDHWKQITSATKALLICSGPQAYVSPSWYASKAEHGRVVPTWNYTAVHLTGSVRVREDATWLRHAVTELVQRHEDHRDHPWAVTDAPSSYIDGQLGGIIGLDILVETATGKAKLSQNRSTADQQGVIVGLRNERSPAGDAIAQAMSQTQ